MSKRKLITLLIISCFLPSIVESSFLSPTNRGMSGVIHVISADNLKAGDWSFRVNTNYVNYRDIYNTQKVNNRFRFFDTIFSYATSLGGIGEFGISTDFRIAKFRPLSGNDVSLINGGNIHINLKLGYMTQEGFGINIYGTAAFFSGRDDIKPNINAISGGGSLIISFDFLKMKNIPLRFHLNAGYFYDRREHIMNSGSYNGFLDYTYGIFHDDSIDGGAALEFPLFKYYITPFVEYFTRQIIDSDGDNDTNNSYNDSPQTLSVGVRTTPVRGLAVDVYYDQSLSHRGEFKPFYRYPPWMMGFAISYTFLPRIPEVEFVTVKYTAQEKKAQGKLQVKVVDGESAEPIKDVVLTIKGIKKPVRRVATDEKGEVNIGELPTDKIYKVLLEKPTYKTVKVRLRPVDENSKKRYLVKLKRISKPMAQLVGKVSSMEGEPLPAVITFKTGGLKPIATNPVSGMFKLNIPAGKYKIEVSAKGYQPMEREIVTDENSLVYLDLLLKKVQLPSLPPPLPKR